MIRSLWAGRRVRVAAACVLQLSLVGIAVAPSLSARLGGEEYRLAVAPIDPIDPFRGAYVTLYYPALDVAQSYDASSTNGVIYVPLEPVAGSDLWQGGGPLLKPPAAGPFLRCEGERWPIRCGIEDLFVSQDDARRLEQQLSRGAVARIRVDGRGNAAVVGVEPPG